MYLSKVYIENLGKEYNFSEDINIVANDNAEIFFNIGAVLNLFISYNGNESAGLQDMPVDPNITFSFKSGEYEYTGKRSKYERKIDKINEKPIICFYLENNHSKYMLDFMDSNFSLPKSYYNNALAYSNTIDSQKFFVNLFFNYYKGLATSKNNNFEYIAFHCENIKRIINSFLKQVNCEDFNFSLYRRTFTYMRNGVCQESRTVYWRIIHFIMDMYYRCMIKNPTALSEVTNENGITVMFDNFGERPSYSDNKWIYYNFLKSVFINFQFITI